MSTLSGYTRMSRDKREFGDDKRPNSPLLPQMLVLTATVDETKLAEGWDANLAHAATRP